MFWYHCIENAEDNYFDKISIIYWYSLVLKTDIDRYLPILWCYLYKSWNTDPMIIIVQFKSKCVLKWKSRLSNHNQLKKSNLWNRSCWKPDSSQWFGWLRTRALCRVYIHKTKNPNTPAPSHQSQPRQLILGVVWGHGHLFFRVAPKQSRPLWVYNGHQCKEIHWVVAI